MRTSAPIGYRRRAQSRQLGHPPILRPRQASACSQAGVCGRRARRSRDTGRAFPTASRRCLRLRRGFLAVGPGRALALRHEHRCSRQAGRETVRPETRGLFPRAHLRSTPDVGHSYNVPQEKAARLDGSSPATLGSVRRLLCPPNRRARNSMVGVSSREERSFSGVGLWLSAASHE
jgi:hypothetical protein